MPETLPAAARSGRSNRFLQAFFRHRLGLVGLVVLTLFGFGAVFAPLLAPHDPFEQNIATARLEAPSAEYPLGTDELGRDILSRLLYGARVSLYIGLVAEGVALAIGVVLGSLAGYLGGWVDDLIMRLTDIFFAVPSLLFLIVVVFLFGSEASTIFVALGLISWPSEARLMRSEILRLRDREFVTAAGALGARSWRVIVRHLLPNALASMIVIATLGIAGAILSEATLSFLGLGIQQPVPSWGTMINQGQEYVFSAWWYSVFPGLTIMLVVLALNFVGDALRDAVAVEER